MIISTAGSTPGSLGDLVCAATSFGDVETELLPALAEDLDADSAGLYQATAYLARNGGHSMTCGRCAAVSQRRNRPVFQRSRRPEPG
jgi:hypothetical protein